MFRLVYCVKHTQENKMRHLRLVFTDKEWLDLMRVKRGRTWRNFILSLIPKPKITTAFELATINEEKC